MRYLTYKEILEKDLICRPSLIKLIPIFIIGLIVSVALFYSSLSPILSQLLSIIIFVATLYVFLLAIKQVPLLILDNEGITDRRILTLPRYSQTPWASIVKVNLHFSWIMFLNIIKLKTTDKRNILIPVSFMDASPDLILDKIQHEINKRT